VGSTSNQLTGFSQTINSASSTSVTYGYNANGDLTSDGLRSFSYNAEGRLSDATTGATDTSPTTRYAHNALGQRVFKTQPLYPPSQGDEADPGFMQSLVAFFTQLWSPSTSSAEQLGYGYAYDEDGTLLAEQGTGGSNSTGSAAYVYLPTASGPVPIAAVINGSTFAVSSDHLNTPRQLTDANGQAVWQWSYSAFGEDKPTTAANRFANLDITSNPGTTNFSDVKFNLRYPGQYADEESGLFYNGYRTYIPTVGRYTQGDPIGLDGGWSRFNYVDNNPLGDTDPMGLVGEEERLHHHDRSLPVPIPMTGSASKGLDGIVTTIPLAGGGGRGGLPNSAFVCRGGQCSAQSFSGGSGVTQGAGGALSGVSTQCKPGAAVEELAAAFKHNQVGVTTVGNIRAAGGQVRADGWSGNPNHATVDGLTAQQLEQLFRPTVPNPVPPAMRR
jgi:RHS repeat-associated protein